MPIKQCYLLSFLVISFLLPCAVYAGPNSNEEDGNSCQAEAEVDCQDPEPTQYNGTKYCEGEEPVEVLVTYSIDKCRCKLFGKTEVKVDGEQKYPPPDEPNLGFTDSFEGEETISFQDRTPADEDGDGKVNIVEEKDGGDLKHGSVSYTEGKGKGQKDCTVFFK